MLDVRVARRDDLPVLHPIIERAYRGDAARAGWTHEADLIEGARTDLATLEAILDASSQRLLVAEEQGRLIGCVQLTDRGDGLAYLGLLCVEPGLQGGGHGKAILAAAERFARTSFGVDAIEMTVIDQRPELIAYYQRRGYQPTGETRDFPIPLDPPLFMTVLEKRLAGDVPVARA